MSKRSSHAKGNDRFLFSLWFGIPALLTLPWIFSGATFIEAFGVYATVWVIIAAIVFFVDA
jgi:hypothetical protein